MVVIIVTSLFVLAIFVVMLRNVFDKKARIRRIAKRGIEAKAVLLSISYSQASVKDLESIKLQIQVYPETGRNFVTEVPGFPGFPDMNKYQIGDSFTVKYNPVNTKELVIIS